MRTRGKHTHLHGVVGGLGHVEDSRDLVEGGLVDVADHAHGGLRGDGSHGSAVAAADATDTDDSDLSRVANAQQQIMENGKCRARARGFAFMRWHGGGTARKSMGNGNKLQYRQ